MPTVEMATFAICWEGDWRFEASLAAAGLAVGWLSSACSRRTKEELLHRARDIETKVKSESALGRPDDIRKLGPVEVWTYRASNGELAFLIVGENVTLQAAGTPPKAK